MPSDGDHDTILRSLAGPIGAFRSAVALTLEQMRGFLASQQPAEGQEGAPEKALLGAFAAGRIDFERFGSLLARAPAIDAFSLGRIEDAYEVLREVEGSRTFEEVHAEPGGDLRDAVARALATVGRAFGAARVFELARTGRYREADHGSFLAAFPFHHWSRAERLMAPPFVVQANGRGLYAEPLAEFLDGGVKIVLKVAGESPLVPLVRLITPGTFVLQTKDGAGLDRLAAWSGPGIAAIVPEGAALFLHDPALGPDPWDRLRVESMPEPGRIPKGGRSVKQEAEEVRQLRSMAMRPPVPPPVPAAAAPAVSAEPADRLAAWLLAQADLKGAG